MSNPDFPLEAVEPAGPVAPWFGGKRYLAKRIIARIDAIPHTCYAEPFVGMGGVFLRRGHRPKYEAVNDINDEIVNLFRVVQEHHNEMIRQFRWLLSSDAEFRRLARTPPELLTDIKRAARFTYLQMLAYGARPATGSVSPRGGIANTRRPVLRSVYRQIKAAHRRLQHVHIANMEWDAFLRRYDRPFTLFYLDPPYWGHEADYGKGMFARQDFARMAELLRALKGRFILSLEDRPEVREIFDGFAFEELKQRYSVSPKSVRTASELLISNAG